MRKTYFLNIIRLLLHATMTVLHSYNMTVGPWVEGNRLSPRETSELLIFEMLKKLFFLFILYTGNVLNKVWLHFHFLAIKSCTVITQQQYLQLHKRKGEAH